MSYPIDFLATKVPGVELDGCIFRNVCRCIRIRQRQFSAVDPVSRLWLNHLYRVFVLKRGKCIALPDPSFAILEAWPQSTASLQREARELKH